MRILYRSVINNPSVCYFLLGIKRVHEGIMCLACKTTSAI